MRKKLSIKLIAFILLIISVSFSSVVFADSAEINIFVDGKKLALDVAPVSQDGRTLIPVRAVLEALKAKVDWDEKTETITISKNTTTLKLKLNSKEAVLNGNKLSLDVPPASINNRTLIPIRFVSENLGIYVEWDDKTNSVVIDSAISYTKIKNSDGILIYEGGYKNEKPNGNGKMYYTTGKLEYEGYLVDGLRYGYGKEYNADGVIIYDGGWKNNVPEGTGKIYFENGKLRYEGDLIDGKAEGKGIRYWEETGNIAYKGDYVNDYPEGYGWFYNKNGVLSAEGQVKGGKLNGKGFGYYTNGNISYSGDFVNNLFEGYGKIYNENGILILEGQFKDGKANGKCIEYNEKGQTVYIGEYKDNFRVR